MKIYILRIELEHEENKEIYIYRLYMKKYLNSSNHELPQNIFDFGIFQQIELTQVSIDKRSQGQKVVIVVKPSSSSSSSNVTLNDR